MARGIAPPGRRSCSAATRRSSTRRASRPPSDRIAITLVDRVEILGSRGRSPARVHRPGGRAGPGPVQRGWEPPRGRDGGAQRRRVRHGQRQRLALLSGHSAPIRSAVFSADGTRVLTAGDDTVARIWDAWTGRLLLTLEGHAAALLGAEFSPDDRFVITREAGQVRLWDSSAARLAPDLARRSVLGPLVGAFTRRAAGAVRGWLAGVAQAPRYRRRCVHPLEHAVRLLAGLWRNTEPPPLRPKPAIGPTSPPPSPCPSGDVHPLAADDDGRRVLLAEGKNAIVRARAGDCRPVRLEGHGAAVSAAAFDPGSDRVLTADDDGAVRIWNATSGRSLSVLHGERYPTKASFLPGHLAVVIDRRHTAVIWDVSVEQRPIAELKRLLHCSGSVPRESLSDLPPDDTECPPIRSPSEEPAAAANALQASGWGRPERSRLVRGAIARGVGPLSALGRSIWRSARRARPAGGGPGDGQHGSGPEPRR